ncbi:Suppressor of F exclusion of phage T7 [Providencia rustigianii]|uniref:FxsA cytoplasmic membrane protein n=2 Tax=Providencia rustigianii TaxID=158850 RepID=D1P266_9GAMM|nr:MULTISPECIES: FxsA family protein [Providencia]EFB72687.1 FxsA cytoplasmic membrane protein [Providencia rustigianii DSM 4541]MTC55987.1 membrane protein FxsA [Providencia rustigianii]MTC58501.1 membrane protein FxsA [Providencia rustigianii]SPY78901.1 Suppressor of F exclusion of phage T7 [Providencia rustigianii]SUC28591.1 Suppressor of F exclusion of phage T7 [Providencia rustigianii]
MRWLPLILIGVLVYIESVIFVRVADEIGVLMTLILVVLTSCLGVSLVKNQGMKNVMQIQQKLMNGESPAAEMIKSVALVLAGFLLIVPGFFTDFIGLLLLLPPVQKLFVMRLIPHIKFYQPGNGFHGTGRNGFQDGNTFEGEFQRKQDDASYTIDSPNQGDKEDKSAESDKDERPKY